MELNALPLTVQRNNLSLCQMLNYNLCTETKLIVFESTFTKYGSILKDVNVSQRTIFLNHCSEKAVRLGNSGRVRHNHLP